ncbi:glycosyltransferase family 4 protein [Aliagarivorans taiwanensis]|uniref:glycosyltransferase family 4 protein n=1 Tax=Aliagarivorans taiwanensis TaxID=561966 RepID=UPI0004135040|nr:glycosyltransferase family 4 protein [Aliagarivorans taiwanensis]
MKCSVIFIQGHSRLRYQIPKALDKIGYLKEIHVEWFSSPGRIDSFLARLVRVFNTALGDRLLQRYEVFTDEVKIISYVRDTLFRPLYNTEFSNKSLYPWVNERISDKIGSSLTRDSVFHVFIRNVHPKLLRKASDKNVLIGDQIIAPAWFEISESLLQQKLWPGWEDSCGNKDLEIIDRVEKESWPLFDHITCASSFVKEKLLESGLDSSKVTVIPYPISQDLLIGSRARTLNKNRVFRVGFIGAVSLRKGAPYFLSLAKEMSDVCEFSMLGPVAISEIAQREFRGYVDLLGSVPGEKVVSYIDSIDAVYFPSTCEGCPSALIEAMARGVPVIASPNSGSIVTHGLDGYICDYRDIDSAKAFISNLMANETEYGMISQNAIDACEKCSVSNYSKAIKNVIDKSIDEKRGQLD